MTSRGQCPRGGGGGACEIPPSGNPVSAPVICVKFWAINPSAPPNQSVPIRLCITICARTISWLLYVYAYNGKSKRKDSPEVDIVMG